MKKQETIKMNVTPDEEELIKQFAITATAIQMVIPNCSTMRRICSSE